LQIIPEEYNNQTNNDYRIRFRYEKQTITSLKGKISLIQYAFGNDINELHQLFASYYYRIATMPRITRIRDLLPDKLGSKLLLRVRSTENDFFFSLKKSQLIFSPYFFIELIHKCLMRMFVN
jgi:hypothetical protein